MNKSNITRITASGNSIGFALKELFQNPDVLWAFTYRDLKVRYAQTLLGYAWSFVQPVLGLAAVFVLFFKIAGINSGGIPYLAFALSGLIFWNYFTFLVTQTAASFLSVQSMIKKIYFPRLSIPFSKMLVGLVDLTVALIIFLAVLWYYDLSLSGLVIVPLIALFTALGAAGIGLLVSALSVRYRDLQQVLPFAMQILFFVTPVAYPAGLLQKSISNELIWIIYLNPMTGILEFFRLSLFGTPVNPLSYLSLAMAVLLFLMGLVVFGRVDKKIADLI